MTAIDLLDEYWLIALSFLHLLVFDTRPGPRNPQYKILQPPPPNFSPTSYVIPTGHGDPLTVHPEFLTDPAQRNFVLRSQSWVLVIPVNLLTRVMRFVCPWSNHYISWWDWGEDVIGVLVPTNTLNMQLVDAKLLVLCGSPPDPKSLSVGVYDLSKLGQKDIQVLRFSRERRDPCKRLLSAPMWFRTLEMGDENPYRLCFIGNKVVGFYVSLLHVRNRSCDLNLVLHRRIQARIIIYASGSLARCEKPVGCAPVTNTFIHTARPWGSYSLLP